MCCPCWFCHFRNSLLCTHFVVSCGSEDFCLYKTCYLQCKSIIVVIIDVVHFVSQVLSAFVHCPPKFRVAKYIVVLWVLSMVPKVDKKGYRE